MRILTDYFAEKCLCAVILRVRKEMLGCAFLKYISAVNENDAVCDLSCKSHFMSDHYHCEVFFVGNPDTTRGAYGKRAILRCLGRTASQNYVVLFFFLILILNQCLKKICAKTIYASIFLIFGRNHHKKTSVYVFYRKISDFFLNSDKKVQEQLTLNC